MLKRIITSKLSIIHGLILWIKFMKKKVHGKLAKVIVELDSWRSREKENYYKRSGLITIRIW
jgi:Na+/H+ antiporter NhaA